MDIEEATKESKAAILKLKDLAIGAGPECEALCQSMLTAVLCVLRAAAIALPEGCREVEVQFLRVVECSARDARAAIGGGDFELD